jgi:hypothetical protein
MSSGLFGSRPPALPEPDDKRRVPGIGSARAHSQKWIVWPPNTSATRKAAEESLEDAAHQRRKEGLLMAQTSGIFPALYDNVKKTPKPSRSGKRSTPRGKG